MERWSAREPLISSRKMIRRVSWGSGPLLKFMAWAITSSSRDADQTSIPWSCLICPILDAISAR